MTKIIELKSITKKYFLNKNIKVLSKINFSFKSGKIYSLTGPSGSGKSTLLNLISLIDRPTSGEIIVDGESINNKNLDQRDKIRTKKIGIVYQEKSLLNDFTALENVMIARIANGINEKLALIESKKILKKVGLGSRFYHYPSELSGGEIQRVAISRALINTPKIILADEISGSLDNKNSQSIFKILFSLKNKSRVIIFATHNRYFANLADYKLDLIDGKINLINEKSK